MQRHRSNPCNNKIPGKEMATHSIILTENSMERGGQWGTVHGAKRVGYD